MKNITLGLLAVCLMAGCDQKLGQHDPLADQPDYMRHGVPGDTKPAKICEDIEANDLLIDASSGNLNFQETVTSEYTFTGRVLQPNAKFSIEVEHLEKLEGATFDSKTGVLKWTPKRGSSGDDPFKHITITLKLIAQLQKAECGKSLTHEKDFEVYVQRMAGTPTITKVDDLMHLNLHEGQQKRFKVTVQDPDSVEDQPPSLVILPTRGSPMSSFIEIESGKPVRSASDPTSWDFNLLLDLSKAEITSSSGQFDFSLVAYSRFGKPSTSYSVQALVFTSLQDPIVTATAVTALATKEFTYTFFIMDTKEEGRLDFGAPNVSALPGPVTSKSLTCTKLKPTQLSCTLKYTPPLEAINKTFVVQLPYTSKTPAAGDGLSISKTVRFEVSVIAPPPALTSEGSL
jgi:hypothetical protein